MRVIECEQNTAEWLEIRRGRITASRFADVMAILTRKSKNGVAGEPAAARINYRMELMAERLTGRVADHYVSPAMEWGHEHEGRARDAYEIANGVWTEKVGFLLHPTADFAGASPDSLVGDDGGLEIKCPESTTHLKWMMAGDVPEEHRDQMYMNMLCGERQWWDFMSYDPRQPEGLRIFIKRLERDEERIAAIEEQVISLNEEVEMAIAKLSGRVIEPSKLVMQLRASVAADTRTPLEQLGLDGSAGACALMPQFGKTYNKTKAFHPMHLSVGCKVCGASKGSKCRDRFGVVLLKMHTERKGLNALHIQEAP